MINNEDFEEACKELEGKIPPNELVELDPNDLEQKLAHILLKYYKKRTPGSGKKMKRNPRKIKGYINPDGKVQVVDSTDRGAKIKHLGNGKFVINIKGINRINEDDDDFEEDDDDMMFM